MSRSTVAAADVAALIKARNTLWVVTREEARVEGYLFEAAAAAGYLAMTWDCAQGVADINGKVDEQIGSTDPGATLDAIRIRAQGDPRTGRAPMRQRTLFIMRDMPVWVSGPVGALTQRALRNVARLLPAIPQDNAQAIIILTPNSDVPPELRGHVTVVEWPMPDREEIAEELDVALQAVAEDKRAKAINGSRDAAIDAAVGLTGDEAASCFSKSLVLTGKLDPALIAQEKKRVVSRAAGLEWFDPLPGGLDAVGGLDVLKAWLTERRSAYTPAARAYGLPAPRGCVLVGVQGCGKSLSAKAIASAWGVPLLKFDLGAQKSKFVGESEQNLRNTLRTVEAIGRCVLWCDEIEKAMQGSTSGSADGGVSTDQLGTLLNWMQERTNEAFVIATSNDVSALPPELLRKGRFDEIFFVDTPNASEREAVLTAALRSHGRKAKIDLAAVAAKCNGFTGAEIANLIPDAMFAAFNDKGREITTEDLLRAAATVVPLTQTYEKKIADLRAWAKGKARFATSQDAPEIKIKGRVGRAIELS